MVQRPGSFTFFLVLCLFARSHLVWASGAKMLVIGHQSSKAPFTVDFGKVYSGQVVHRNFVIQNRSGRAVSLLAETSCGCTQVHIAVSSLGRDQSTDATVTFHTAARNGGAGPSLVSFLLMDSTKKLVLASAKVEANLMPSVTLSPEDLRWLLAPGGRRRRLSISLTNSLPLPVVVGWREPKNATQTGYSIRPSRVRITSGASAKITISLSPSVEKALYLSAVATIRVKPIRPAHTRAPLLAPWNLSLRLTAVPRIPLVVIPGSVIIKASDFMDGRANCDLYIRPTLWSKAVVKKITVVNPLFKVSRLKRYLFRLTVSKPKHAIMDTLDIVYALHGKLFKMPIYAYVYK